ncbi:hypothetical protein SDC9_184401 [bioreactor metagenome]|uniref:Uncharacterized protein n=1 Tax=bioreactor metagenome TaxID=1076179 RepID=A0A645HFE8_9ZZZZ
MKHDKRLLIGMLLLTIFLISMAAPVSAYSYSGYKWNTNYLPIRKTLQFRVLFQVLYLHLRVHGLMRVQASALNR